MIVILLFFATKAFCEGTVGAVSLRLPHSAFHAACADITTVASYADALFYNPALLPEKEEHYLSFTYNKWIFDTKRGILSYTKGGKMGIGVGISYLLKDEIRGESIFSFFHISALLALCMHKRWASAGIALKVLQEQTEGLKENIKSNLAFSVDFGISTKFKNMLLSFCAKNSFGSIKYKEEKDPLPFQIKVAAGIKVAPSLKIHTESVFPREKAPYLLFGVQKRFFKDIFVQAGYNPEKGRWSAGFLLFAEKMQFAYAYMTQKELENIHFFTLSFSFSLKEKEDRFKKEIEELKKTL